MAGTVGLEVKFLRGLGWREAKNRGPRRSWTQGGLNSGSAPSLDHQTLGFPLPPFSTSLDKPSAVQMTESTLSAQSSRGHSVTPPSGNLPSSLEVSDDAGRGKLSEWGQLKPHTERERDSLLRTRKDSNAR